MSATPELDNLHVVLVNTRNPLNIGAAARAMSNFGCLRLRVVNPFEEAWREARSAVGGAPLLRQAQEYSSVADAVGDCVLVVGTTAARDRELHHEVRSPIEAEPLVREQLRRGQVGLLFGSEKRGLSNEDLSRCHWLIRIPTRIEHSSMNLGQAVAVCLYELIREARIASNAVPEISPEANSAELDRLTMVLLESLAESGYSEPRTAAAIEEKTHRLIRRLNLSTQDTELLTGMMRKILWKLRNR